MLTNSHCTLTAIRQEKSQGCPLNADCHVWRFFLCMLTVIIHRMSEGMGPLFASGVGHGRSAGAEPGFLKSRLICIKVC